MTMSKEQEVEPKVSERWSTKAKTEVVLGLFRGEGMDAVSREIQVPMHELETSGLTSDLTCILERSGNFRCYNLLDNLLSSYESKSAGSVSYTYFFCSFG